MAFILRNNILCVVLDQLYIQVAGTGHSWHAHLCPLTGRQCGPAVAWNNMSEHEHDKFLLYLIFAVEWFASTRAALTLNRCSTFFSAYPAYKRLKWSLTGLAHTSTRNYILHACCTFTSSFAGLHRAVLILSPEQQWTVIKWYTNIETHTHTQSYCIMRLYARLGLATHTGHTWRLSSPQEPRLPSDHVKSQQPERRKQIMMECNNRKTRKWPRTAKLKSHSLSSMYSTVRKVKVT